MSVDLFDLKRQIEAIPAEELVMTMTTKIATDREALQEQASRLALLAAEMFANSGDTETARLIRQLMRDRQA